MSIAELFTSDSAEAWKSASATMSALVESLRGPTHRSLLDLFNEALLSKEEGGGAAGSLSRSSGGGSSGSGGGAGSGAGGGGVLDIPVGTIPFSRLLRFIVSRVPSEAAAALEGTLALKARSKFLLKRAPLSKKAEEEAAAAAAAAAKAAARAAALEGRKLEEGPLTAAPVLEEAAALGAYEVTYVNFVSLLQNTLTELGAWKGEAERNWRQMKQAAGQCGGGARTPGSARSASSSPRSAKSRMGGSSGGFSPLNSIKEDGERFRGDFTPLLDSELMPGAASSATASSGAGAGEVSLLDFAAALQRQQRLALGLAAFCRPLLGLRSPFKTMRTTPQGALIPLEIGQCPPIIAPPPLHAMSRLLATTGFSGSVQRSLEIKAGALVATDGVESFGREHSAEDALVSAGVTDGGSVLCAPHGLLVPVGSAHVWVVQIELQQQPLGSALGLRACYEGMSVGEVVFALGCLPHTLTPLVTPPMPLSTALMASQATLRLIIGEQGTPVLQGTAHTVASGDLFFCRLDAPLDASNPSTFTVEVYSRAVGTCVHTHRATLPAAAGSTTAWLPASWQRVSHRPLSTSANPAWCLAPPRSCDAPFPPSLLPPAWQECAPLAPSPTCADALPWPLLAHSPLLSGAGWLGELKERLVAGKCHCTVVAPELWGSWVSTGNAKQVDLVCLPLASWAAQEGSSSSSSSSSAAQWRPTRSNGQPVLGEQLLTARSYVPGEQVYDPSHSSTTSPEFPTASSRAFSSPLGVCITRGRYYFECTVLRLGNEGIMVGWGEVGGTPTRSPAWLLSAKTMLKLAPSTFFSLVHWLRDEKSQPLAYRVFGDAECAAGDVLCCALDADEGVAMWGKNGQWGHPWGVGAVRVSAANGLAPMAMVTLCPTRAQGVVLGDTVGEQLASSAIALNLGGAGSGGGFAYPPPQGFHPVAHLQLATLSPAQSALPPRPSPLPTRTRPPLIATTQAHGIGTVLPLPLAVSLYAAFDTPQDLLVIAEMRKRQHWLPPPKTLPPPSTSTSTSTASPATAAPSPATAAPLPAPEDSLRATGAALLANLPRTLVPAVLAIQSQPSSSRTLPTFLLPPSPGAPAYQSADTRPEAWTAFVSLVSFPKLADNPPISAHLGLGFRRACGSSSVLLLQRMAGEPVYPGGGRLALKWELLAGKVPAAPQDSTALIKPLHCTLSRRPFPRLRSDPAPANAQQQPPLPTPPEARAEVDFPSVNGPGDMAKRVDWLALVSEEVKAEEEERVKRALKPGDALPVAPPAPAASSGAAAEAAAGTPAPTPGGSGTGGAGALSKGGSEAKAEAEAEAEVAPQRDAKRSRRARAAGALPDGLPGVISTRTRPPPLLVSTKPGVYLSHRDTSGPPAAAGGSLFAGSWPAGTAVCDETLCGPLLVRGECVELACVVTPMRADGWPVPRREQGWSHHAATLGLSPEHAGPSALLDPTAARISLPPPLPSDLRHSLNSLAPGRGLPITAAYYEVALLWRRSGIPAATKRFKVPSPGKGSIAADCVALALEWEPMLECHGGEFAMVWVDRRGGAPVDRGGEVK